MATHDTTTKTGATRHYGYPAARVMLAGVFVVTGWDKLANPQGRGR